MNIINGIKSAVDEQNYNRCLEYLKSKGYEIYRGTELYYIEVDNDIKAVAGWHEDLGSMIEPLVSDNVGYTRTLGIFMTGFIKGKGYGHITCKTNHEQWKNILIELGFNVVNENTTILAKGI